MSNGVRLPRGSAVGSGLACLLGALLFAGCGKQSTPTPAPPPAAPAAPRATNPPPVAGPGPGEKACFQCAGTGLVACRAAGCKNGQGNCPGGCLSLSRGVWTHMNVAGHGPNELWISFKKGSGGSMSWSQGHVGEVIVYQNGDPVNIGTCKVCGGTTTTPCAACKGTGKQTCEICSAKKFVPVAWTPTDNPWFNRQPDVIRLKDGQVVLGRVAAAVGDERTIITRDKKILHVQASEILPKAETNPPAPAASSK
jgi:hypothetical protein